MKNRKTHKATLTTQRENLNDSKGSPCFFEARMPVIVSTSTAASITRMMQGDIPRHVDNKPRMALTTIDMVEVPYLNDGKIDSRNSRHDENPYDNRSWLIQFIYSIILRQSYV